MMTWFRTLGLVTLASLQITISAAPVTNGRCQTSLAGRRPNRKTVASGTSFKLKDFLVAIASTNGSGPATAPTDSVAAYWPDVPLFSEKTYRLAPGAEFRALGPVRSRSGKTIAVELQPGGEPAVMYWVDVYNNARVIDGEGPAPTSSKPKRYKFPNAWRRHEVDALWAEGMTAWGRPRAEIGQIVWTATHTRVMSRGSVGELMSVDERGVALVRNRYGKTTIEDHRQCVPLTPEEASWFPPADSASEL